MNKESVFRFLFRLSAEARRLPTRVVLQRLVNGLANRYGAAGCAIYRYGRLRGTCWADPSPELTSLSPEDRANLHNLDGRLVQEAMTRGKIVSALDLDVDGDITDFLDGELEGMDIFAFPLMVGAQPRGALIMYLTTESESLGETDMQAMLALGEVLEVAQERRADQKAASARRPAKRGKSPTTRRAS